MEDPENELGDSHGGIFSTQSRYARLGTYQGTAIGVCIFLSSTDLRELNIEPGDHEVVKYQIRDLGTNRVVDISGVDPTAVDTLAPSATD